MTTVACFLACILNMKASVTTSDRLTPPKKNEIEVPILEHARFESSNGYGNESYTYLANQKRITRP